MKKINWSYIGMFVLLIAATLIGAYLMEEEFCETMSGLIWIAGEVCLTAMWVTKEILKWPKKYLEKLFDD